MSNLVLPDARVEMEELFYPNRKPVGSVKIDSNSDIFYCHINNRTEIVGGSVHTMSGGAEYVRGEFVLDGVASYSEMKIAGEDIYREEIAFYTEFTYQGGNSSASILAGNSRYWFDSVNRASGWTLEVSTSNNDLHITVGLANNTWASTPSGVHTLVIGKSYKAMGMIANGGIELYVTLADENNWVSSGATSFGGQTMRFNPLVKPRIGSAQYYGSFFEGIVGTVMLSNDTSDRFYADMKKNPYQFLVKA